MTVPELLLRQMAAAGNERAKEALQKLLDAQKLTPEQQLRAEYISATSIFDNSSTVDSDTAKINQPSRRLKEKQDRLRGTPRL